MYKICYILTLLQRNFVTYNHLNYKLCYISYTKLAAEVCQELATGIQSVCLYCTVHSECVRHCFVFKSVLNSCILFCSTIYIHLLQSLLCTIERLQQGRIGLVQTFHPFRYRGQTVFCGKPGYTPGTTGQCTAPSNVHRATCTVNSPACIYSTMYSIIN
jgi:hypothetical protein